MSNPIIKVENLEQNFEGYKVLENVNLTISQGEIFGIIGASGTGKTTFLNSLIGFIPTTAGEVLFKDSQDQKFKNVFTHKDTVKRIFGFAAQRPSFYEKLTVFENIDYFGSLYNLSAEARLNNINTLLELVELESARNVIASNLSGGMQRRLDIACSLIHSPEILILDEPTSDLDLVLSKQIWKLTQKINKRGTTIIVASHDLAEIEHVCHRFGIISQGHMSHVGSLHDLVKLLSKGQEIHVETYPGNYDELLKKIKGPHIKEKEHRGSSMVLHTTKPDKVLHDLLKIIQQQNETLIDIRVSRLRLKDVFTSLAKKPKKR